MKPSWDDAPPWALYLAQDADGGWWWFGRKPLMYKDFWAIPDSGPADRQSFAGFSVDWQESLERKPG